MTVWGALGFMFLGGAIVGFFNWMAWRKYYEGKDEGQGLRPNIKGR